MRTYSTTDDEILIIGGTGTLGKALLARLSRLHPLTKVTVLSREELKQQQLKPLYPDVKFVLGDVRDAESIADHTYGKSAVFHLAAMKHVDMAEDNPFESLKINAIGTLNVANACIGAGVPHCIFASTDKAVNPVNVYGACKMLSERFLLHYNKTQAITKFSVFRWGNVLGSRGSVIHAFVESLKTKKEVNITDPRMTRFWVNIDDMARFMLENYETAPIDKPIWPEMKARSVLRLAELCAHHLGVKNYKINYSGIRRGEKLHECIHSEHDLCVRSDNSPEFGDEEILEMIQRVV